MKVLGVTSKLPQGLRLFFYEYDDVSEFEVYEDCNFLSQVFDLDIYVLESSPRHYHALSFDVLSINQVERVQNWALIRGDYLTIKEQTTDRKGAWNALRIGDKGKKPPPTFLKVFYAKQNPHCKSLSHYLLYRELCRVPEPPKDRINKFEQIRACEITVYNTGIGAKPRKKGLWNI